ncbi:MAG: sulfatase [Zavarzinella sp.]
MRYHLGVVFSLLFCGIGFSQEGKRLNFIWIGAEDISPTLGCYGDKYAITPNLDKLAGRSARFTHCFTHAPVCAPTRSGMITGMYPTTMGSHHMRSTLLKPPTTFTAELRKAGYRVMWPGKTDFNFAVPEDAFDSTKPWLNQAPPKEPFFAYINFTISHESQIRAGAGQQQKNKVRLKPAELHDPAKAPLPPYYPDTPVVRRDVANYYDNVTALDYQVGDVLAYLDKHRLWESTVVLFFGDHGWGMPRGKRWCYDSGSRAPLMVSAPGWTKPGSVREDLVGFIDFGPTMLHLANVQIPTNMQGKPFLGKTAVVQKYAFTARDRMDETFDRIRSVRDQRYRYIRNFYPQLPYAQHLLYMDEMPTMKEWRRLAAEGKLNDVQKLFFAPTKPKEEFYDTQADPHEVVNLIDSPAHQEKIQEFRKALDQWIKDTNDLGEVPETELIRRGLVKDRISKEYADRIKQHPPGSKASTLAPKE